MYEIRLADLEHAPGIVEIMQQNLLSNLDKDTNLSAGFLIHGFSQEYIENAVKDDNFILYTALDQNEVVGYCLGCRFEKLNAELQNKFVGIIGQEQVQNNKILYYRHIAKKRDVKGVGKALLSALLNDAQQQNYQVVLAQIIKAPIRNEASENFHKKFGFEEIGIVKDAEFTAGLYRLAPVNLKHYNSQQK